jgi:hypothetical protein
MKRSKRAAEHSERDTEKTVDSEESFQKTYFPEDFARLERERDSAAAIGQELSRESASLIESAFACR